MVHEDDSVFCILLRMHLWTLISYIPFTERNMHVTESNGPFFIFQQNRQAAVDFDIEYMTQTGLLLFKCK